MIQCNINPRKIKGGTIDGNKHEATKCYAAWCVHVFQHMFLCVRACMRVCVCACMHMRMHSRVHVCECTRALMPVYVCMCACVCAFVRACVRACVCVCVHACVHESCRLRCRGPACIIPAHRNQPALGSYLTLITRSPHHKTCVGLLNSMLQRYMLIL